MAYGSSGDPSQIAGHKQSGQQDLLNLALNYALILPYVAIY